MCHFCFVSFTAANCGDENNHYFTKNEESTTTITYFLFLVILILLLAFRHQVVEPAELSLREDEVQEFPDKSQRQNL